MTTPSLSSMIYTPGLSGRSLSFSCNSLISLRRTGADGRPFPFRPYYYIPNARILQGFARKYSQLTAQKLDSLEKDVVDGVVRQAVKNHFALAAAFDDARAFEEAELMGDGGLIEVENAGQIGDAKLADGEGGENFHPRVVGKDGKKAHELPRVCPPAGRNPR